jgi:hypothetical protein
MIYAVVSVKSIATRPKSSELERLSEEHVPGQATLPAIFSPNFYPGARTGKGAEIVTPTSAGDSLVNISSSPHPPQHSSESRSKRLHRLRHIHQYPRRHLLVRHPTRMCLKPHLKMHCNCGWRRSLIQRRGKSSETPRQLALPKNFCPK